MKNRIYLPCFLIIALLACGKKEDSQPVDDPTQWTESKRNDVVREGLEKRFGVTLQTVPQVLKGFVGGTNPGEAADMNFSNEDAARMRDATYTQEVFSGVKYNSWASQTFPITRKGKEYQLVYYQPKANSPNSYVAVKGMQEKGATDGSYWPLSNLIYP